MQQSTESVTYWRVTATAKSGDGRTSSPLMSPDAVRSYVEWERRHGTEGFKVREYTTVTTERVVELEEVAL